MKINFIKIKIFLQKLLLILAEKSFLFCLIAIFIALIIGGVIFYQYSSLLKRAESQIEDTVLQFKEETYQRVLRQWQEREEKFEAAATKQYLNPFKNATSTIELTK